jgi:cytoskeletal protein CcmA (bactofilin family)
MCLRRALLLSAFTILIAPGVALAQDTPQPPGIELEDQIVFAGSVTVPRGQRVGEVVVFSGRVTVNGVVAGDVVVLEGPVTVTGQVNGSVIAADGDVRLAESARVGGDVFSSDSVLARPGAKVGGESRSGVRFSCEGPLVTLGKLLGPIAVSVSVLLTGLALLFLAPRGADAVAEAMASAPLASVAWGLLLVIAVPVAALALVISVLGLPLGLALFLSFGLWWLVGLTWTAWCAGRGLVRAPRGRVTAFFAGWAILAGVGLVPILNAALWTLAPPLGLGAMLVAAWRSQQGGGRRGRHRSRTRLTPDDAIEAGIA